MVLGYTGKRLQTRLMLWTSVILIVTVTAASEIRTRYNIHLLESNLQIQSETLVGTLSKTVSPKASSPAMDVGTLGNRLREFVDADRTLTRLDVVRSNGVPPGLKTWIENKAGERVMVTSSPLEGTQLALIAFFSMENIDRYQEINRWISPLFSFFLIALVIVPMFLLYSHTISRRFDELLENLSRAQQGEIPRISKDREDEIGTIAETLSDLVNQVRTFSDGLQLEIARATRDLDTRKLALEDTSGQMLAMQRRILESERLATVAQMAATFAHEIGSPMSSLSAHVQRLLEDSSLEDDQRETLTVVRKQIQSVVQIVNDILRSASRDSQRRCA
jgi:C4-dicarboxylate-specific signal transduction histidine kinase